MLWFPQVSRRPGWGRGAPGIPATRGRAHLPRTCEAAAEAGRSPSGCGPGGPPTGLRLGGHVALARRGRIPALSARGAHRSGLRRTGRIRSESAAAAEQQPPAPGGALGAAWPPAGALKEGCDRGLPAPSRALRTGERDRRSALGGRARRPPGPLPRRVATSPAPALGDTDLTLPETGQGVGKGGWRRRPAPSKQERAPPPTWAQVSPPLG